MRPPTHPEETPPKMPLRPSTHRALLLVTMMLAASAAAPAQTTPPPKADAPLTSAQRHAVVDTLARELRARYVYPERAEPMARQLVDRARRGAYDGAATVGALGEMLDKDLREVGQDGHMRVRFMPQVQPEPPGEQPRATREEVAEARAEAARQGYGVTRVQRLPGNIGYLDLRGFGPTEFVAPAYDAAMLLLAGTDALVLDLRNNGGGSPSSVSYLLSHFFAEDDERHLNDIYDRPTNRTRSYFTMPIGAPRYLKPIAVLTSKNTFSGGEECAYDLQTQKRATLYGETTGGGAHPGGMVALGEGLAAFVPTGRPINPVTGKDWEKVGVAPEVALPAADALKAAYLALLEQRDKALPAGAEGRDELTAALAKARAGTADLPPYTPRR
jgi:hypothetical protein